jgi:membrane-associated phospholipid phosphatase
MFVSTVVTGNHYFLDGLLGLIVATSGLGIAYRLQKWGDRRALRREQAQASSAV